MQNGMSKIFVILCVLSIDASLADKNNESIVDITQNISTDSPCAEEGDTPYIKMYEAGNYRLLNSKLYPHVIYMTSFCSTCIAAPSFYEGNWHTVNSIDPKFLIGVNCYKIDISNGNHDNLAISLNDIKNFENEYGEIQGGSVVVFFTGWSKYWERNNKRYINKHPVINLDAIEYLCSKGIAGIGIDAPSIDLKRDGFSSQIALYNKGKYLIKNISEHANRIPAVGSKLVIAPLKFEACNEAPIRIYAVIDHNKKNNTSIFKKIMKWLLS